MEGASILIVEDEAISALYLKNLLTRMEYQVLDMVASGENAITKANELKPDLVLMDIRLAGEMDGIQAADSIHSKLDIPVVFLTAHLDEDSMRRAMATEPAGYVPKPTSDRELRGTIEMALKNDTLRKQLRASEARYRNIFKTASVSISEIDFSQTKQMLDDLRKERVSDIAEYMRENPGFVDQLFLSANFLESNEWNLILLNASNAEEMLEALNNIIDTEGRHLFQEIIYAIWEEKPYYEGEGIIRTVTGEPKYITVNISFFAGGSDLSRVLVIGTDISQRKIAEIALRESEEKYRRIVDTAQEGICIIGEDNYVNFVNARLADMLGYEQEEIVGQQPIDFLFPEDHYFHYQRVDARRRGIAERYERRFRCKDGRALWTIVSASPMLNDRGEFTGTFAMFTDITERRMAERDLAESEERYRILVESASEIIGVVQNERLVFINAKAEQVSGYSRAEIKSLSFKELIHAADYEGVVDIHRRKMNGEPVEMPFRVRIITKSGEVRWMEVNSTIITWEGAPALLNFYIDITESRKVEEQLRLQATVLDQIQDMVTITDLNGRITYINDAESQQLKYSNQEMIGQSVELYGDDSSRGATQKEIIEKTLTDGAWRGEVVNFDAQGNDLILDCRTQLVYDEEGKPVAMCGISTDISERKRIEKALAESEARYRQIVETTQEGIWILDHNFKIVFVNQRLFEMLGYSYEELIGMHIDDLVYEEDMVDHKRRRESRKLGVTDQYERRFRRKDGKQIWVNVTATPIFDSQGQFQGPIALITDITARKEADQVLQREQTRIRTLDTLSQELSKLNLDFQATLQTAAVRIIELNNDLCIIRLVSDDGQYLQPIAVHHPDPKKRKLVEKLLLKLPRRIDEGLHEQMVKIDQSFLIFRKETPDLVALMQDEYIKGMEKIKVDKGMVIPLKAQDSVIGDIILGRNVEKAPYNEEDRTFYQEIADRIALTISNARMYSNAQKEIEERRKIETEIRLSESKYRDLFELSPDSNILVDTTGVILDCNLSTSNISGLPKEEMVGNLFSDLINLPPEIYQLFFSFVEKGELDRILPLEAEITRKDGQNLILEVFPKLIEKDGDITGVQVISRDITDRKLNEQKLKDSLAEKEMLLSELNHRVKNNLASIVSILDLQKNYLSDTQMVDLVSELQERVRLLTLVHEQLYGSKNLSQIDIAKYLEDLTANLGRALIKNRDIHLDTHADASLLSVAVAIPCGQIVTELMTNALKYAFPEEKRELWENMPRKIEIGFQESGEQYILTVSDNGVGLPRGVNFENAETLGMQLVCLLTRQLGGVIEANGHPGTTVCVKFPCSPLNR
ncbi:MAG: PAS domain S-box protein [Anaerolineales bacterium]|nr:PAS domain S-box protein [Anaerolineales bacterium]